MPYFHEITKLSLAYIATSAEVIVVDESVQQDGAILTATVDNAEYQWLDCNNGMEEIPSATDQQYTVTISGSYAVRVTIDSCSGVSTCLPVTIVSTGDAVLNTGISIYPNPVSQQLSIEINDPDITGHRAVLHIFNPSGTSILQKSVVNKTVHLPVDGLPAGIYYLQIQGQNTSGVQKFIKQ